MIKIRPPPKRNYEGVTNISGDLQNHFITLLVGKPGSGKSHLISEFIRNPELYFKKFNAVYFVAASKLDGIDMDEDNWNPGLDPDWMLAKVHEEAGRGRNILFVLDDVIAEIKKMQNDPRLMKLIFNRRHLSNGCVISYLITSQKYIVCPPRLRSCLTSIIFFKVMGNDWRKILEECVFEDMDKYKQYCMRKHLDTPHNFIYLRLDNSNIYLNFEKFN